MNRMAFGMARELQPHHVAVVALAPGFVGTEHVRAAFAAAGRAPPTSHRAGYPRSVRDSNAYAQQTRVVPGWLPSANHHSPWACLVSQPRGSVKPLTVELNPRGRS